MPLRPSEALNSALPRIWIRPYYSSFNGIRGLAVLLVFFNHFGGFWSEKISAFTWEGVDLFFVLSGFLITGILYDSLETQHFFRNFYIRRALRIFPVFYVIFLLLLIFTPLLKLHYDWGFVAFFFYIGNFFLPYALNHGQNPTTCWMLLHGKTLVVANIGHFWSLNIEEQFYMVWPAVVWFLRDRKKLMRIWVLPEPHAHGIGLCDSCSGLSAGPNTCTGTGFRAVVWSGVA